jgi:hypothetical protein
MIERAHSIIDPADLRNVTGGQVYAPTGAYDQLNAGRAGWPYFPGWSGLCAGTRSHPKPQRW